MAKWWERVLGVVAGCYIAVVCFCMSTAIDIHARDAEAARVAQREAAMVTMEYVPYAPLSASAVVP